MEHRLLNNWIDGYLKLTESSESPYSFRRWVAISIIASALQRKCSLAWGPLIFYPNLFIILVSPLNKCRMSTAISFGVDLIHRSEIDINITTDAITESALISELNNYSSLTICSQELAVLSKHLMIDLIDWYDCRDSWRHKNGVINNICVNLIAATTPTLIESYLPLGAIESSMIDRTMIIYSEEKNKIVPTPFLTSDDVNLESQLISDVKSIAALSGEFKVTEEFKADYQDWYLSNYEHFTRQPAHILKLCMVLSASRTNTKIIDSPDMLSAIEFLEESEKSKKSFLERR